MKKWIAMALALVVCLGVFTACKKEQDQNAETVKEPVQALPVEGDELEAASAEIVGEWRTEDNSFMILVSSRGDVFNVDVEGNRDGEWEYWNFSGDLAKVDGYQIMGVDCCKYEVTNENDFSQTLVYSEGVSTIVLKNGVITWNDAEEDAGKGLTFMKVA